MLDELNEMDVNIDLIDWVESKHSEQKQILFGGIILKRGFSDSEKNG